MDLKIFEGLNLDEKQAEGIIQYLDEYKTAILENAEANFAKTLKEKLAENEKTVREQMLSEAKEENTKKDNKIKILESKIEKNLLTLLSEVADETERKIINESAENDPVYKTFDTIKKQVAPFLSEGIFEETSTYLKESKDFNLKKIQMEMDLATSYKEVMQMINESKIPDAKKLELIAGIDINNIKKNLVEKKLKELKEGLSAQAKKPEATKKTILEARILDLQKKGRIDENKTIKILNEKKALVEKIKNDDEKSKKFIKKFLLTEAKVEPKTTKTVKTTKEDKTTKKNSKQVLTENKKTNVKKNIKPAKPITKGEKEIDEDDLLRDFKIV